MNGIPRTSYTKGGLNRGMNEVKWIKIVTDIFDDEKILLIENLPSADSLIVIWFKLLCLAGKNNNNGVFLLNDKIVYTDEMLATIFRRDINTVRLALRTFEEYGMIEIVEGVITIPNWGKHQTMDKLEAKKEYQREYMKDYREKQKKQIESNTNSKVNSKTNGDVNSKVNSKTNGNANRDVNVNSLDIDKDIDIDNKDKEYKKEIKHRYGEYHHVLLTDKQYSRLVNDYGEKAVIEGIKNVDEYCQKSGRTYKDYNLVLRDWGIKSPKLVKQTASQTKVEKEPEISDEEFFAMVDSGFGEEES